MVFWKRCLFFLSLFALLFGALWIPFRTSLTERCSVLKNGWGDRTYLWATEGENGLICAASRDGANRVLAAEPSQDGLELRFFNQQGEVLADWSAPLPKAALDGELCALYPLDTETAFLAVWQEDDWGGQTLCVYRAEKGGLPEPLLSQRGSGSLRIEQRDSVQISSFSRSLDQVFFVLLEKDRVVSYVCPVTGGGVEKREEQVLSGREAVTAAALPDGSLAMGGAGFLLVPERNIAGVSVGQTFSHLTCTPSGIYCVEDHAASVWFSDLTGASAQQLFSLSAILDGHRLSSLSLTPNGEALLLLDGHTLLLVRSGGVTELTAALYPSRSNSLLALAVFFLGVGLLVFLIWQVLSIANQSRVPMALYWGTVVLALALAAGAAVCVRTLVPMGERTAQAHRAELFGSIAGLALREDSRGTAPLPGGGTVNTSTRSAAFLARRMEALLSDAGAADIRNFHATLGQRNGQMWLLEDGTRAELGSCFHPTLAGRAEMFRTASAQEGDRFWYCRTWGGSVLCVSADLPSGEEGALVSSIWRGILMWCALYAGSLLLVLLLVNLDVRRLAGGLERYAGNQAWIPLRLRSGDELEGMAASLNALAQGKTEAETQRDRLVASYRRFVPEPVIGLLGKRSILDVGKESFAVRNMTVMAVSFTFPSSVYIDQNQTHLLFESVNQVIERTASIAAQKGGTVFNFNYDGYDVVMEDTKQAVSAAVAMGQEALALNERRVSAGLPSVTLRIALDVGSVVIGIVGDGAHLNQTTISSRFAAVRKYLRLCEKLDANILCTENVSAYAEGYGCRYVGKCRVGEEAQRIYEIFDADLYATRTQKASTLRRFSQAVLSLYSGDTSEAKRTFLKLAHETPNDGGARYYLYLADRLEQNSSLPCELDDR